MNNQSDSGLRKEATDWLFSFPRLLDLYQHSDKSNPRNYFNVDFPLPLSKDEERFARLDSKSWTVLRDKAVPYVSLDDPLRHYQQLWSTLDEARGYVFLADQGYERIEFIEPAKSKKGGQQSPDLVGHKASSTAILEVKTVNESTENLSPSATWRHGAIQVRPDLSSEFKGKLVSTIEQARNQLNSYPHPSNRKIVLLVVRLDCGQKTGGHLYEELGSFITSQPAQNGVEVYHQATLG
jgi:hypothetical protein